MGSDPHWTAYLTALLTPTIAGFGIYIAIQQWLTARRKLKFDLFDRRFAVYDAARSFLASISTSGKVKSEETQKFLIGTREATWLLNADIAKYLFKQIYHNALHLEALEMERPGMAPGPELTANVTKQREIKDWMFAQYDVLDEKFAPFLQLEH